MHLEAHILLKQKSAGVEGGVKDLAPRLPVFRADARDPCLVAVADELGRTGRDLAAHDGLLADSANDAVGIHDAALRLSDIGVGIGGRRQAEKRTDRCRGDDQSLAELSEHDVHLSFWMGSCTL